MSDNNDIILPETDSHTFKFNEFQLLAFPKTNLINDDENGNYILETNYYSKNTIRPQRIITVTENGDVSYELATKDKPLVQSDHGWKRSDKICDIDLNFWNNNEQHSLIELNTNKSLKKKVTAARNNTALQNAYSHL